MVKSKGLVRPEIRVESEPQSTDIKVGQWYWVRDTRDESEWLGCVTGIGTNYAELTAPFNSYERIHFDEWGKRIVHQEIRPERYAALKIEHHRKVAAQLMGKVKQLTAKLGLTPSGELTESQTTTALVVANKTPDIEAHKKALIKAKEETLPKLFKEIEEEHEKMATWMKANLIPLEAQANILKEETKVIKDRIFTVELYAGLIEQVTQIRDGEPASNDEKIRLFQRRHYMDEECLLDYQVGGMKFDDIRRFDRWLLKKKNRTRLLPFPKCVVAFRVRRHGREFVSGSIVDFISFCLEENEDKTTFIYIRNGDRYYRLTTGIDFGAKLFPDADRSDLLHGKVYMKSFSDRVDDLISEKAYNEIMGRHAEELERWAEEVRLWKEGGEEGSKPWKPHGPFDRYTALTPESVFYDDGIEKLDEIRRDHNRLAIVMQGLLDRSPVFHPHPPWRIWTPEGFGSAFELVFDEDRTITDGDPPDFEAYRQKLNVSIKKGCHTVGQEDRWQRFEAEKENEFRRRNWRQDRYSRDLTHYTPYGNPGPGLVAKVVGMSRDGSRCDFQWERERLRTKYKPDPTGKRWRVYDDSPIAVKFRCSIEHLLNVDAYTPGDFLQFYEDPRTRVDYLKWAPMLLAAEDFYAKKKKS